MTKLNDSYLVLFRFTQFFLIYIVIFCFANSQCFVTISFKLKQSKRELCFKHVSTAANYGPPTVNGYYYKFILYWK